MNEQNNIVSLHQHALNKKKINPFDYHSEYVKLENDKIFSKRLFAFGIDMATVVTINTAINSAYALFISNFYFVLTNNQQDHLIFGHWGLQWSVTMTIFWTYFIFCNYTLEGKTFGKMAMKIRTIDDQFLFNKSQMDYTPSIRQSLKRTFGYFVCYISFGTFFSFPLFSEDKRGVPDFFSQTRSVSDEWLDGMLAHKKFESDVILINISSLEEAA